MTSVEINVTSVVFPYSDVAAQLQGPAGTVPSQGGGHRERVHCLLRCTVFAEGTREGVGVCPCALPLLGARLWDTWEVTGVFVPQFDYEAVASRLFAVASQQSTPSQNRKRLYKVIRK